VHYSYHRMNSMPAAWSKTPVNQLLITNYSHSHHAMKQLLTLLSALALPLLMLAQETTRLALLPQTVKIEAGKKATIKCMGIDHYRTVIPPNQPIKMLYDAGTISVTIDGKPYTGNFAGLVTPATGNPAMQLFSDSSGNIVANMYSLQRYKEIVLKIDAPAYMGTQTCDKDVMQAKAIFKLYGYSINQNQFFLAAQCADMVKRRHPGYIDKNLDFDSYSLARIKWLYAEKTISRFNDATLTYMLDNNLIAFTADGQLTPASVAFLKRSVQYAAALTEASTLPKLSEAIASTLVTVKPGDSMIRDTVIGKDTFVLTVAWKTYSSFSNYLKPGTNVPLLSYTSSPVFFQYALFFTMDGEIKKWYKQNNIAALGQQEQTMRIREVLGLTPDATNDYFVEMWIRRQDIFRPSEADSCIGTCVLSGNVTSSYLTALNSFFTGSYNNLNMFNCYPFTKEGYTYDWSKENTSHVGLSEFVLRENAVAYIRRKAATEQYFKE